MSRKYTLWYFIFGLVLVAVLVLAVILNENYSSDTSIVEGNIAVDNGDLKINWERYSSYEVELKESLVITNSGTYHLTGSLNNGNVIINVRDGYVKLILDNVTIKSANGPAISCLEADDLVIELVGKNDLEDSSKYTDLDEDISGAIYSKADLTFEGSGILNLVANYQDGIVSKDDLKFNSGTYIISAVDDGIRGKDSVCIIDGNFKVETKADAIKSTNETTNGKGFILIENGSFELKASAKGIKAVNNIIIRDGGFKITSTDDGIHSNNYIGLYGGKIEISSGDDGIHADKKIIIDSSVVDIKKSYEGIEAQAITINSGEVSIVANDDGMNAGGGADASSNNRPGANPFDADVNCVLTINGGKIYINAAGDGIDSNGYLYINGGDVVVDGPTNSGNGALDSGAGIFMTGGTVVAVGASGMAETLGTSSSVYNASIYFSSTQIAGTVVTIKDADNKTIISHASKKTFNHMSVGTEAFVPGQTYTIYIDGVKYQSFTISSITTTIGNNNSNQNMGPGPMNGGRR